MLHIIRLILKILGIILLCVAALLILLLSILLFVPVRYELKADFPGKISDAKAGFRLTWLFHLLSLKMYYEKQKFTWRVRAAWKKFPKEDSSVHEEERRLEQPPKEPFDTIAREEDNESSQNTIREPIKQPQDDVRKESLIDQSEKINTEHKKAQKKSFGCKHFKEKLSAIWQKIKYTFTKICDKIKNVSRNISDGKETLILFLNDEIHRSAFKKVKKELIWIKRLLKPKLLRIHLNYGFEDPCLTGQVLAFLSVIYPFVGDNMDVEPDFEQKILKGDVHIKGRIRMIYLVIFGVKLFLHKETRKTVMEVMHIVTK